MERYVSEVLTVETADGVATVWLDRPDKLNAMNLPFWDDLPRIMHALGEDDEVRVAVIQGRGRAFTVGIDLSMFADPAIAGTGTGSPAASNFELYHTIKRMQDTMTSLDRCPKPVIAAIHGHCLGGGVDLITAADIRIASTDATFGVRETRIGMVADVGTMQRLPLVIPAGHAAQLLLTGEDIGAQRALEIGLVNDVYPSAAELHEAAADLAGRIAANSPLVTMGIKQVLRAGRGRSTGDALDYMAVWNAAFLRSNDLREGVTAQIERRDPKFTGE